MDNQSNSFYINLPHNSKLEDHLFRLYIGRILLILLLVISFSCSEKGRSFEKVTASGDVVKIPLKSVSDGNVHFFTFPADEGKIHFFIRMDGTGKLHTHFDACYTCYKFDKGYRVEGTEVVCNECGFRFRLADEVWEDRGGCVPIGIPHTSDSDSENLIIQVSDLKRGAKLYK